MKVIFMGTPLLAAVALKKLIESRHEVVAVVTKPDKASGRGMSVRYSPVKQTALEAQIPVLQPVSVKAEEVLDEIESFGADLFVVAAYAQIIPQRLLDMAPYGCINIHPSLLPKYRGAAPLRGPIVNGDSVTGVTIMNMSAELDAGDILLQEEIELDPKETVRSLTPKVTAIGADMLIRVIDMLEKGEVVPVPQGDAGSTYIRQMDKEDGRIRFAESDAVEIERQIRACDPWPSAFTKLGGKAFKIWDADVVSEDSVLTDCRKGVSDKNLTDAPERSLKDAAPGCIVYADKKTLIVKCREGCLSLKEVQIEGKKRMGIEEFLRGRKLEPGFVFGI